MDWTQTISILGAFAAGFLYLANRISKLDERLACIDQRLSRLEGAFEERGRWESGRASNDK
jgi:hypothetical protein